MISEKEISAGGVGFVLGVLLMLLFALSTFISNIIAAALIASLTTLSGILATIWITHRKETRDQNYKIKENVYLPALESIIVAQSVFYKMVNLKYSLENLQNLFVTSSIDVNKVQLIGNLKTVMCISGVNQSISIAYSELMEKRDNLIRKSREDLDYDQHLKNFTKDCITAIVETSKEIIKLKLAIRNELNLPIDTNMFTDFNNQELDKAKEYFDRKIDDPDNRAKK